MSLRMFIRTIKALGQGTIKGLPEATEQRDPIELFGEWFEFANKTDILLPEAMTLATSSPQAKPSARMVLLKGYGERGFDFFTNYQSRKANELETNPYAALVFHWPTLQRQIRIEGIVNRLSPDDSAAYFRTRPRGSQIGAWASRQSKSLSGRTELEKEFARLTREYEGKEVPLPSFWGGYRLKAQRIEFWQGKLNRLHDRIVFERGTGNWSADRLYP